MRIAQIHRWNNSMAQAGKNRTNNSTAWNNTLNKQQCSTNGWKLFAMSVFYEGKKSRQRKFVKWKTFIHRASYSIDGYRKDKILEQWNDTIDSLILDEIEILQQETADSDERFANVNNNKRLKENWRVPFFTSSGVVLVVIRLSIGSQEGVTRHPSSAFSVGWLKSRIQFFSVRPPKITKNRELVGIWKKKSGMRFSKMKKIGKSRPVGKSGTHPKDPKMCCVSNASLNLL